MLALDGNSGHQEGSRVWTLDLSQRIAHGTVCTSFRMVALSRADTGWL
jgi:hypothetical protein